MSGKKKMLLAVLFMPLFILFSVISHEYGHVIGSKIAGVENVVAYVWPGYEIYPSIGSHYEGEWPKDTIGLSRRLPTASLNMSLHYAGNSNVPSLNILPKKTQPKLLSPSQDSIIKLMGSGLNLLISILSIIVMYRFKPKGMLLVLVTCGVLLHYDLLFYSVFPILFDLPHLVFWGGQLSEPVVALAQLGFNQMLSVTVVVV
ncbi:MAG: hypothetical protein MJK04_16720, partial [Psychrosphaera sp.]|nr:hypothetical protein [Psychrosphaera sp.]